MSDVQITICTAGDGGRQLEQYREVCNQDGADAIVVCLHLDGTLSVLIPDAPLLVIADVLKVASQAAAEAAESNAELRSVRRELVSEPCDWGEPSGGDPVPRRIGVAETGMLVPPEGENFISCGSCAHPRWHVLLKNESDSPARFACAACGNEVELIPIYHREGHA